MDNLVRRAEPDARLTILEAGVYRGGSSWFLAALAERWASGRARMFSIDTFEGHSELDFPPGVDEGAQAPGVFSDTSYEEVREYLSPFPFVEVIKGRFQDVAGQLAGERFDLVHFDMDLYEPTAFALPFVAERLSPGGIVVMDDYTFFTGPGEGRAVDEFWAERSGDFTRIVLQTGQCCLVHHPRAT